MLKGVLNMLIIKRTENDIKQNLVLNDKTLKILADNDNTSRLLNVYVTLLMIASGITLDLTAKELVKAMQLDKEAVAAGVEKLVELKLAKKYDDVIIVFEVPCK